MPSCWSSDDNSRLGDLEDCAGWPGFADDTKRSTQVSDTKVAWGGGSVWNDGSIHHAIQVESEASDATNFVERNKEKGQWCVQQSREYRCTKYAMSLSWPLPSRNGFKGLCVVGTKLFTHCLFCHLNFFPFDPQDVETTSA